MFILCAGYEFHCSINVFNWGFICGSGYILITCCAKSEGPAELIKLS